MVPHSFTLRHPPSRIFPCKVQQSRQYWCYCSLLSFLVFLSLPCALTSNFLSACDFCSLLLAPGSCGLLVAVQTYIYIQTLIFRSQIYPLMSTSWTYFFCLDWKPSSAVFILLSKRELKHLWTNLRAQSFRFLPFFFPSFFYSCFGRILFANILLSKSSLNLSKALNLISFHSVVAFVPLSFYLLSN